MSLVSNNNFLLASSCDSRGQEIPNPLTSHTVRVAKQMLTVQNSRRQNEEITMSDRPTESKRPLSYVIAEWACGLKYEHLSPEAIQAAKLFWFDSIGCALGGSQQDDAKILLKHYRAMSAGPATGGSKATAFVSGFQTNPVDAAFLNGHMIRAMDYNDIYWKADPCHP